MLIFGSFRGQRLTIQVPAGMTVSELKEKIKRLLGITPDLYRQDKKILALTFAGADLHDDWLFADLGILPGSNIKIKLKEEVKPVLYIHCSHTQETVNVYEDIYITRMKLEQIRCIASMKTGLPVGIFRLITQDGQEMFDGHRLDDYGVDIGQTILLENWDGWNEFLNLAIMGFTPQVISQIGGDEAVVRYQKRVALFIASHFGHVDLARYLLRLGCRSDEPTGYHPSRAWCQDDGHKDSRKCPVHEATLCGQLAVLKLFVLHDITCLKAKDGDGLEPINLALRKKIKNCAMFLVSKQWSKVNLTKIFSVRLATYALLKSWCHRAKERALVKYGVARSSLKRRTYYNGALVTHGVFVDGFSRSPMNGKTKAALQREEKAAARDEQGRQRHFLSQEDLSTDGRADPESYFRTLIALHNMKSQLKSHVKFPSRLSKNFTAPRAVSLDVSRQQGDFKNLANRQRNNHFLPDYLKPKFKLPELTKVSPVVASEQRPCTNSQQNVQNDEGALNNNHRKGTLRLMGNTKGAYFQSSVGVNNNYQTAKHTEPNDKVKTEARDRIASDAGSDMPARSLRAQSLVSGLSLSEDAIPEEEPKSRRGRFRKKKARLSDAMLLSKAKSSEGGLPLPLVSIEQARRPFFYHQGLREDDLVEPMLGLVSKYKGATSRERAIKSLTLARTFTGKPWLSQVKVALNLSNNNLRRGQVVQEVPAKLAANCS